MYLSWCINSFSYIGNTLSGHQSLLDSMTITANHCFSYFSDNCRLHGYGTFLPFHFWDVFNTNQTILLENIIYCKTCLCNFYPTYFSASTAKEPLFHCVVL